MARRKKKRNAKKMTIPIAPMIGLLAGMDQAIERAMNGKWTGTDGVGASLKWRYLGLNESNKFAIDRLKIGLVPLVLGLLVHKYVGGKPLNANRILANAGVPIIRI